MQTNGTEILASSVHDEGAEETLIGVMLRENEIVSEIAQIVRPAHFYSSRCKLVFQCILDLLDRGGVADSVIVADHLNTVGLLNELGPTPYAWLAELWTTLGMTGNAEHYARIVKNHAIQRALHFAGLGIVEATERPHRAAHELVAQAEQRIIAIAESDISSSCVFTMRQCMNETTDWIDRRSTAPESDGVPTGFVDLDELTGGLHDSDLILLAARPSVGKTALACNIARNVAGRNMPVFFCSLEQSRIELTLRLLTAESGIDGNLARKGNIPGDGIGRVMEAKRKLERLPIFVDDSPMQSTLRIASQARRLKRKEGIRLVVIDYLQLIEMERERGETMAQRVGLVSRRLKLLARELRLPVLALAQLNRQVENRGEEKPKLSDLRDSGSLEQDADSVLLLWRPEGRESNVVEALVEKQRNGPTGPIRLTFLRSCVRFENHAVEVPR